MQRTKTSVGNKETMRNAPMPADILFWHFRVWHAGLASALRWAERSGCDFLEPLCLQCFDFNDFC
jgi:hypothetical protein